MRRLRHAPIIQKWFPQDELPQRALDDGGDWWAGAQRCFVGVALASAVAALGTSVAIASTVKHNDEIPRPPALDAGDYLPMPLAGATPRLTAPWADDDFVPPPSTATGGGGLPFYGQRLRVETKFQRWGSGDELPLNAATALDDGSGWSGWFPTTPPVQVSGPAWDDAPLAWTLDEVYTWSAQWVLPKITTQAPADDEVLPPQPLTATGGGGLPFYGARVKAETRFQRWAPADDLPVPVAFVPDEEAAPDLPRSADSATFVVWATSDEIVTQPTALPVDELYWQPPARLLVVAVPPVWAVDDAFAPASPIPNDDYWLPLTTTPVPPVVRLWLDQEEVTTLAVPLAVDEDTWPLVTRVGLPFVQVWTDSDDYTAFALAEDDAPIPRAALVLPKLTAWQGDDDIVPQPIIAEEDHWLQLYAVPVLPLARWWVDQDEVPLPGVFADDAWQVHTPPPEPKRFVYLPDPEELVYTPPVPLAADEDYWLTFPVPPKPLVRSLADYLPVDEDAPALTGVPPVVEPTIAELLAMIQALQAELDDVAKRAGNGGGGGDPVEHQLHRGHDAKRERINAQNALLMALVGSMMANRFGGKITSNKEGAGGFVNPTREGKQS